MTNNIVDEDLQHLFPKSTKIVVGTKNPKIIEFNPELGFKTQWVDIPGIVETIIALYLKWSESKIDKEIDALKVLFETIQKNVIEILILLTGLKREKIEDMTNAQLIYAIDVIFSFNYEEPAKNVKALADKIVKVFGAAKSLPEFARDMDTQSNKSEDSQQEKSQPSINIAEKEKIEG